VSAIDDACGKWARNGQRNVSVTFTWAAFPFCSMMLTVLKNNPEAMSFYRSKLKYAVDEISPSACGDSSAAHEILSKATFPAGIEARKAVLACFEEGKLPTAEQLAAPGVTVHVRT
jgi:hypothetical protein